MPETPTNTPPPAPEHQNAPENVRGQTHDALLKLATDTQIPLTQRTAALVERRSGTKPQLKEVTASLSKGRFGDAVKTLLMCIFGSKYAVEGVGYFTKHVQDFPPDVQGTLLKQLEQHDQVKQNDAFGDRMRQSVLRWQLTLAEEQRKKEGVQKTPDRKGTVEMLQKQLRRGDVIIVSQHGAQEEVWHEVFEWRARKAYKGMGEPFHGTHVMVFDGEKLRHVNRRAGGKEELSPQEMFAKYPYTAATVARLPDEAQRNTFMANLDNYTQGISKYNTTGLLNKAVNSNVSTDKDNACICSDYVAAGLGAVGNMTGKILLNPSIGSPGDVAKYPEFQLAYSLEIPS